MRSCRIFGGIRSLGFEIVGCAVRFLAAHRELAPLARREPARALLVS